MSHDVYQFPIAKYLHGLYYFILLAAILKGLYTRTQVIPQRYILSCLGFLDKMDKNFFHEVYCFFLKKI